VLRAYFEKALKLHPVLYRLYCGLALKVIEGKQFKVRIVVMSLLVLTLLQFYPTVQAQNTAVFTPTEKFSIPQLNGSISFAFNGTYTSAVLQNDTWIFTDLTFNNSLRLGNLNISVKDSDITIFSFYSDRVSTQFTRYGYLRYFADGAGVQTFNLNINTTDSTHSGEWGVINPGSVFLAEGREWQLLSDNTIIVYNRTGNITISHYGFGIGSDSSLPFYLQHSVGLITLAILVVTVAAASLIQFSLRRKPLHGSN